MPNPTDGPPDESVEAQTARLLVEFLDRKLDLTETMVQLVRSNGDDSQTMQHIHQGLDTIRKFLGEVTSPEDHARIARGLERLESEVATLGVRDGEADG